MRELPADELQFILNTFSFLAWGALVMWMCAGFTMLEAGSVRTKNASVICLKNIGLYAIAGLALEKTVGARVSRRAEELGGDVAELGIEAYPEFVLMPEQDEED